MASLLQICTIILPIYDHRVIVVEENQVYVEILGKPDAPYSNSVLKKAGAWFGSGLSRLLMILSNLRRAMCAEGAFY